MRNPMHHVVAGAYFANLQLPFHADISPSAIIFVNDAPSARGELLAYCASGRHDSAPWNLASVCAVLISKYERSGEKRHAPSSKRAALILVKIRPSGHLLPVLHPHPRPPDYVRNGCRRSGAVAPVKPEGYMAETEHTQMLHTRHATTTLRGRLYACSMAESRPVRYHSIHERERHCSEETAAPWN
ncbi:hypothetical protein HBI38_060280 [Parastagonospora nodorum]|nr:hypothetical protein HBH52_160860 [Parastagonospora nodorum]KAH4259901.1 hypothetical protein HBI03_129420 [Parastagonospora nodorum]KAH4412641.1 hypothetical protein HBH92_098280 [Parastagonospora nodorum]KAH4463828.1 hypothetical protein HBH91_040630 [Parastagonospora nodorum]KAH4534580.1 hypothetical protein HBH85_165370 [Parastagonospora nodorum]